MDRIVKALLAACFIVVSAGAALAQQGGSLWSVEVKNSTQTRLVVNLYYNSSAVTKNFLFAEISSGDTYTFKIPGAYCANGLDGSKTKSEIIMDTDMYGTDYHGNPDLGAARCGNHKFEIVDLPNPTSYKKWYFKYVY